MTGMTGMTGMAENQSQLWGYLTLQPSLKPPLKLNLNLNYYSFYPPPPSLPPKSTDTYLIWASFHSPSSQKAQCHDDGVEHSAG